MIPTSMTPKAQTRQNACIDRATIPRTWVRKMQMQKKWTILLKRRTAVQRLQLALSTDIHQPNRHCKPPQALSAYSRHEGAKGRNPRNGHPWARKSRSDCRRLNLATHWKSDGWHNEPHLNVGHVYTWAELYYDFHVIHDQLEFERRNTWILQERTRI
jgi:hypothetical protein